MSRIPHHGCGGEAPGRRHPVWAVVIALLMVAFARAQAQATSDTNAAPAVGGWTFHPLVSTNAAPADAPTNPADMAPTERPALSMHPADSSTNAPDISAPQASQFNSLASGSNSFYWSDDLASHLLVVYNANDADSKDLAAYYASKRSIPAERVLAINCPLTEEISRHDYNETIRSPIITYLSVKNWLVREQKPVRVGDRVLDLLVATRNDIWAIVLMRGVPLKIAQDPDDYFGMEGQSELQANCAAVDNELALLPVFGLPLGGFVPNIFFDGQNNGLKDMGPRLSCDLVLVTRLDGPTPDDVRRMIDDTLYAEKHRLAGLAVVDTRGMMDESNGYTIGDDWLRGARDALVKNGWPVKFDASPDLLPPTDPVNQVAIYLGWYSADATGPWVTRPNRFVRGAIAYHLHSFSASTLRSDTHNWVGPLIAHGAAATMGMVYEPYLAMTPHEDIFTRRLLAGDYFAEAAYASERGLSWMLTVVGDPLYRPFLNPLESALSDDTTRPSDHADWLTLQRAQLELDKGKIPAKAQSLVDEIGSPQAGPVAFEGLGDMLVKLNDPAAGTAAERAYLKAVAAENEPIDRVRVTQKLAQFYRAHGQNDRAQTALENVRLLLPTEAAQFGMTAAGAPIPPPAPSPTRVTSAVVAPTPRPHPGQRQALPQLPQLPKPTPATP